MFRLRSSFGLLVAALGVAAPASAELDVPTALAQLEAPAAEARRRAERWLTAQLATEDFPLVAAAASGGGAETLLRLGNAVGADDRHLPLAALCFADEDKNVRRVGKRAIEDLVVRWMGSEAGTAGVPIADVLGRFVPQRRFQLTLGHRPLVEEIDLVDRAQRFDAALGLPRLGLAIDPALRARDAHGLAEGEPRRGTWIELFASTVAPGRFEGRPAWSTEAYAGTRAIWIRVVEPAARLHDQSAEWILARWLRTYLTTLDRGERERVALALAGTGWPAVIAWFERRWFEEGESAALAGLVHAAARGSAAVGLSSVAGHRELVAALERSLDGVGPSTGEIARALISLGRLGADGSALDAHLVDGWSGLSTASRRVRLAILAEIGGGPAEFAAAAKRRLDAEDELDPGVAWWTVRALGARPSAAPFELSVASARRVFRGGLAEGSRPDEIARALVRAGAAPPEAWRAHPALAACPAEVRLGALAWWLQLGPADVAAAHLRASPEDELELARLLAAERRRGRGAWVRTVWAAAFTDGARGSGETGGLASSGDRPARLAVLSGLADDLQDQDAFLSLAGRARADLVVLGALAGSSSVRDEAWERLVDLVRSPGTARVAWVAGLERALRDAVASGDDTWALLLRRRAQALVRDGDPLARPLRDGSWPPGPGPGPPDLARLGFLPN